MTKALEEYMHLAYRLELTPDSDEGGFVVSYPDLPGCLSTGDTVDEAIANAEDAKKEWFEAALEMGQDIPLPDELDNYSGQFKLRIPRSLHRALSLASRREGVSMNQYCVYLLSQTCA